MTDTKMTHHPRSLDWGRAIWSGLAAGVVFVAMEMILVATVGGGSPWGPPRMMAAIVMDKSGLPGPDNPPIFDAGIVAVGMVVHFVLSIVLGLILAMGLTRLRVGTGVAIVIGVIFGLAVYLVNFYGFTIVFPWFEIARNPITIASHLVFGAVIAAFYGGSEDPSLA